MPRFVAAVLCATLIWFYPDILSITLEHAAQTEQYVLVYSMLTVVTIVLSGLIALYIWLGYKAGPSGLEHALRQFAKTLGKDREDEAKDEATVSEDSQGVQQVDAKETGKR